VVTSYEAIIHDKDDAVIDRRIVEAKYMKDYYTVEYENDILRASIMRKEKEYRNSKGEEESFKLPTAQEAVDNIRANMSR